jgi:hypothetical protein
MEGKYFLGKQLWRNGATQGLGKTKPISGGQVSAKAGEVTCGVGGSKRANKANFPGQRLRRTKPISREPASRRLGSRLYKQTQSGVMVRNTVGFDTLGVSAWRSMDRSVWNEKGL